MQFWPDFVNPIGGPVQCSEATGGKFSSEMNPQMNISRHTILDRQTDMRQPWPPYIYSIATPIRQSLTVGTNSSQDLTLVFAQYNALNIYRQKGPLQKATASEPELKIIEFYKNICCCNQYLFT